MQSLNIFMARNKTFDNPIWTEFYQDAFGFGKINTVTLPAYYFDDNQEIGYFIGIAAIDILLSQWQNVSDYS